MATLSKTITPYLPICIATLSGGAFTLFAFVVLFELALFSWAVNALLAISYGVGYGHLIYAHVQNTTMGLSLIESKGAEKIAAGDSTSGKKPRRRVFLCFTSACQNPNCLPKSGRAHQGAEDLAQAVIECQETEDSAQAVVECQETEDSAQAVVECQEVDGSEERVESPSSQNPAAIDGLYQSAQLAFLSFSGSVLLLFFLPATPINTLVLSLSICTSLYFYYNTYQKSLAITPIYLALSSAHYHTTLRAVDRALGIALLYAHALFESVVPLAGLRTLFLHREASLAHILGTGLLGLAGGVIKVKGELSAALPITVECGIQPSKETNQPWWFQQLLIASKGLLYLLTFVGLYKELASHLLFAFSSLASWPVTAGALAIGLSAIAAGSWTWVLFQSAEHHVCAHQVSSSLPAIGFVNLFAACTNGLIATAELIEIVPLASSLGSTGFLAITSISFLAGMLIDSNFLSQGATTHSKENTCGVVERFIQDSVVLSSTFKLTASNVCQDIHAKILSNAFFSSAQPQNASDIGKTKLAKA